MTRYRFTSATPAEWLSIDTAARWLDCPVQHIRTLAQTGRLRYRTSEGLLQIDSNSLDKLMEDKPVPFSTQPQTFTKINGRVFEELSDGRLIPVR
jgi:hypothetical protein